MKDIEIDLWLYGVLARFAGSSTGGGFATIRMKLPPEATLGDLLETLGMATEERGFTFINGSLSAKPGVQADLARVLHDGDRVAFFHLKSMWPFQYRQGVPVTVDFAEESPPSVSREE